MLVVAPQWPVTLRVLTLTFFDSNLQNTPQKSSFHEEELGYLKTIHNIVSFLFLLFRFKVWMVPMKLANLTSITPKSNKISEAKSRISEHLYCPKRTSKLDTSDLLWVFFFNQIHAPIRLGSTALHNWRNYFLKIMILKQIHVLLFPNLKTFIQFRNWKMRTWRKRKFSS